MEVSGQFHSPADLPPGKFGTIKFHFNYAMQDDVGTEAGMFLCRHHCSAQRKMQDGERNRSR